MSSFDKWVGRGINCLVGYESEGNTVSYNTWKAAAVAKGMKYIVQWSGGPLNSSHNSDPNLLAVMLPDEPDGANNLSPGQILDMSNAIRAVLPSKPIFLNLDGVKMQWRPFDDYRCYALAADIISMDMYPLNAKGSASYIEGPIPSGNGTGGLSLAERVDYMKKFGAAAGGSKQYWCAIECSDQNLKVQAYLHDPANQPQGEILAAAMRGPTVTEMTREVGAAVKHGCTGLFYFPDKIGVNFEAFDNTPSENASAMTALNTYLNL
jgi:hypothetical protein